MLLFLDPLLYETDSLWYLSGIFIYSFIFFWCHSLAKNVLYSICFSHYSTPFSPYKPFFCSYAYYKNNVIYNFSLPLFLLSLLHTFNFIYSYVPFCVCEYICSLTLWILFGVRRFYNGILLSCSVLSSGSYINVQNQFSFFFFIFFLHFFIPFVFTPKVYDFLQFNIHTSKSSTFKIYKNNGAIFDLAT